MNRLDDLKLLDESVIIYSSDHGLTLGEHGIVGKHGSRAQWHIYHVPFMIRHPEGKLAGQWDDYFASNHDITRTALSFMGARAGDDGGEDLSVIFDGKRPPPRPHFTSCYDDHVLAGDYDWFFIADSAGGASASTTRRTTRRSSWTWPTSTRTWSRSTGASSPTRPAARCRSSAATAARA